MSKDRRNEGKNRLNADWYGPIAFGVTESGEPFLKYYKRMVKMRHPDRRYNAQVQRGIQAMDVKED